MSTKRDAFDQALDDTTEELQAAAEQTLADHDVREGLADPNRDDTW